MIPVLRHKSLPASDRIERKAGCVACQPNLFCLTVHASIRRNAEEAAGELEDSVLSIGKPCTTLSRKVNDAETTTGSKRFRP